MAAISVGIREFRARLAEYLDELTKDFRAWRKARK